MSLLRTSKGFTLVELLVVISIIAVLSTIAMVSYRDFVKKGRDVKRQSDLSTIRSALEQYRVDKGTYPLMSTSASCASLVIGEFLFGCPLKSSTTRTYLNDVPKEQVTTNLPYKYLPLPNSPVPCTAAAGNYCTSYCLYAQFESTPPAVNNPPALCTDHPSIYNFVTTPP